MNPQIILRKLFQENECLVFGHRGAKAYVPMNTIAAFELALQQGAHGIELDVHRSKDGYPVIVHDFTVDETTDGEGLVTEMTLAELKSLDAGSWFGEEFRGLEVPTLDEVFEAVGHKMIVNVEIKSESEVTDGVEQVTADCIVRHAMSERVIVSSFNPYALSRFRQILPNVPIGFLYDDEMEIDTSALMNKLGVKHEARHPYHTMIDQTYMDWATKHGYLVNTWTVNDPEEAIRLRDLGVNCIITDQPDVILQALNG